MFRAIRPAALYRSAALYKTAPAVVARNAMALNFARTYASAGLARSDVEKRVLDILAGFNKIDANKVIIRKKKLTAPANKTGICMESQRRFATRGQPQGGKKQQQNNKTQKSRSPAMGGLIRALQEKYSVMDPTQEYGSLSAFHNI
jgi:hypothetical protein